MTKGSSATAPVKDHERGTPRGPLSSTSRWSIIILSVIFSAGCTTWLFQPATQEQDDWPIQIGMIALVAAAGAVSSLVGVLHDTASHAVALTDAVVLAFAVDYYHNGAAANYGDSSEAVVDYGKAVIPLLGIGIVSAIFPGIFAVFSGVLNPYISIAFLALPFLSFLLGYAQYTAAQQDDLSAIPIEALVALGAVQFIMLAAWHVHRPSKLLNLTLSNVEDGKAVAIGLATLMVAQAKGQVLLPLLTGALVMAVLWVYMGAVADSWYTVGSGQFWMVSLDGTSLIPYLFFPILVLVTRFHGKFGDAVHEAAVVFFQSLPLGDVAESQSAMAPTDMIVNAVSMLLTLGTVAGIPYAKSLCPFSGFLYGMAYTHGQQSTHKVAIVLPWSAFSGMAKQATDDKVVLNYIVTATDLTDDQSKVDDLKKTLTKKDGHTAVLSGAVKKAHEAYQQTLGGVSPEWYFGEDAAVSTVAAASKLDMRICTWSSTVSSQTKDLTPLVKDVEESLGGTILYVQSDASVDTVQKLWKEVTEKGYTFAALSDVAKREKPMLVSLES